MSALGDLYLKISADTKPLKDALSKSSNDAKKWARDSETAVGKVTKSFSGLKTAIAGAMAVGLAVKGFDLMYQALSRMEVLDETSQKLGVTAERLQELGYAAEMNGSSAEEMNAALEKLHLNIGLAHNGTGKLADVMTRYGLSLTNANGSVKSTEQVFNDLIKLLGTLNNENEKAAILAAAFGKEMGPNLALLIGNGNAAIEQMAQKARELGIVLDNELVAGAAKAKDHLDTLKMVIGAEFTRAIVENSDTIKQWADKAIEAFKWVVKHSDQLMRAVQVLGGVLAAVFAVKTVMMVVNIVKAIGQLANAFRTAGAAAAFLQAMSGPAGWASIAAGVIAAGAAVKAYNYIMGDAKDGAEDFKVSVDDLNDSLSAGAKEANAQYTASIAALQAKFAAGKISAEEFRKEVERLDAARRAAGGESAGALSGGAGDKAAEAAAAKAVEAAKKKAEEAALEERIAEVRQQLAEKTALLNEVEAIRNDLMTEEEKAAAKTAEQLWTLQKAREADLITAQQYNDILTQILSKQNEQSLAEIEPPKLPEGAFAELEQWEKMMEGLKSTQDEFINGFSDELASALVDGKSNFQDFAKSIIKQILKMIIQMMIFRALGGLAGSSNPALASFGQAMGGVAPGGKASGGAISGPTLVGERGPEIFTPSSPGRIINNTQSRAMMRGGDTRVEIINRGTPSQATSTTTRMDGKGMIVSIILEDIAKGGKIAQGLGAAYGLRRTPR